MTMVQITLCFYKAGRCHYFTLYRLFLLALPLSAVFWFISQNVSHGLWLKRKALGALITQLLLNSFLKIVFCECFLSPKWGSFFFLIWLKCLPQKSTWKQKTALYSKRVEQDYIQFKTMELYYTLGCNEEPVLFWRPYACLGLWYIFSCNYEH